MVFECVRDHGHPGELYGHRQAGRQESDVAAEWGIIFNLQAWNERVN